MKRVKDSIGRYYCETCRIKATSGTAVEAPSVPVTAPKTAKHARLTSSTAQITARPIVEAMPLAATEPANTNAESRNFQFILKALMVCGIVVGLVAAAATGWIFLRGDDTYNVQIHPELDTYNVQIHPELLLDKSIAPTALKAGGLGIGDPEASIRADRIKKVRDKYGLVQCDNDIAYRISDGKIVGVTLGSSGVISRFGLVKDNKDQNRVQIPASFGSPSRVTRDVFDPEKINTFYYDERNLAVSAWGDITIVAEPSIKQELRAYVAACEPFVRQIHVIDSDFAVGLDYSQFEERLRQLVQLQEAIASPPSGDVNSTIFKDAADKCVAQYTDMHKAWANMISLRRNGISAGPYSRDSAMQEAQKCAKLLNTQFVLMKSHSND